MELARRPCRACQGKALRRLALIDREGEPPGAPGHVVVYRHTIALACSSCGAAEIERLDHDCWDHDEVWDQYEWYLLDAASSGELRAFVAACTRPQDAACRCRIHEALRKACAALPGRGWSTSLEQDAHVHSAAFTAHAGAAAFEVARS